MPGRQGSFNFEDHAIFRVRLDDIHDLHIKRHSEDLARVYAFNNLTQEEVDPKHLGVAMWNSANQALRNVGGNFMICHLDTYVLTVRGKKLLELKPCKQLTVKAM